jgi:meso-butanediol dehydrogenase/(S,S)-butanediol dehydrogenase/diacetyl reductase
MSLQEEADRLRGVAVVTGAARGIGREVAARLAADGFDLALLDRDAEAVEVAAAEHREAGGVAVAIAVDIADPTAVAAAFERIEADLGPPRVVVANAGVAYVAALLETDPVEAERLLRVNVLGTLNTIQAAAGAMVATGKGGKVIVASSMTGRQGFPLMAAYSASKFAIVGLVQAAAAELAEHGITVNAYCPGVVDTPMNKGVGRRLDAILGLAPGAALGDYEATIPLGRISRPEEVAGLVSFLASADSDYMTGQSLLIDGGVVRA